MTSEFRLFIVITTLHVAMMMKRMSKSQWYISLSTVFVFHIDISIDGKSTATPYCADFVLFLFK